MHINYHIVCGNIETRRETRERARTEVNECDAEQERDSQIRRKRTKKRQSRGAIKRELISHLASRRAEKKKK